jgi:hypothetical protein
MIEVIARRKEWTDRLADLQFRMNNFKRELHLMEADKYLEVCGRAADPTERNSALTVALESNDQWVNLFVKYNTCERDMAKAQGMISYYSQLIAFLNDLAKNNGAAGVMEFLSGSKWARYEVEK